MRVVSLLASGTEIVCALGAGETLVGRSHECDNPSWVKALPACSAPSFDISVSSLQIDLEVRRRIRSGEPLYRIDNELIAGLAPDLVISQAHCEVCAVTPGDIERGCLSSVPTVLALTGGTLQGVFDGFAAVARAMGLDGAGAALIESERSRLDRLRPSVAGRPRPSVVVLEWMDPIFAMGNWGPELVEAAGGELSIGKPGEYSSAIPFERILEADPEFLIVAPCGFDLSRTLGERATLEDRPGWSSLRAVRAGKVAWADGNLYFNRSGTTVVRTAEILAEILHGVVTGEPSEGSAWRWA